MQIKIDLELADLINSVATLRHYAGKLSDYGAQPEAARFRTMADRVLFAIETALQAPAPPVPELPS